MVGYNITNMSQGSLTGVKVLMCTTSFVTLNERVLLVLDGDEFEISIMEMKPDFRPLLTTIKHSIDATCTQTFESHAANLQFQTRLRQRAQSFLTLAVTVVQWILL
jgi:hypothetical protein